MRRFLLATTLTAALARPAAACPDMLVGDSLAVGMAPAARAAGWTVLARTGVGVSWLGAQRPRCAARLVLVLGTNDLLAVRASGGKAYIARIGAALAGWRVERFLWATPGCPRRRDLAEASRVLDVTVVALRGHLPPVHRGRVARCETGSPDGIHTTAARYRVWWRDLAEAVDGR